MSLAQFEESVPKQSLALWWLGQAGFAMKTSAGRVLFVDPYLSDAVERLFGFKRLSPPSLLAEEVRADWVVLTHEHADHLDPDALPVIVRNNPACRFAAPVGCEQGLTAAGAPQETRVTLHADNQYDLGGVTIHAVRADHGDLSASALSLLLDFEGIRVVFMGDTAYRSELVRPFCQPRPDILFPCINGGFGNMGHVDAARLVEQVQPRYAIPCHYWTFAEQGAGDPAGFLHACRQFAPQVEARLLRPGERFVCRRADA